MQFESIQDLFDRTAGEHAAEPAIDRAGETLTYRQVRQRSDALSGLLAADGVGAGDLVGLFADDPRFLVPAVLGVLKAGAAFVPLDPAFPGQRLGRMADKARPARVLTTPAHADRARELFGDAAQVAAAPAEAPARPERRPAPDDRAYVYFTSGSTGEPKGIVGRLCGIDHFVRWEVAALGLGPGVRVSQLTTPSFDAWLRDVFVPLACGGTACAPEDRRIVLDGARLVEWLDLEEIEVLHTVPSVFRSLLAEPLRPGLFAALRFVLLAGEPLPPADCGRWHDVFGDRVRLVNLYGPSETTMTKLAHFVRPEDRERRSVPIGRPIDGARALLLDARGGVCAPGSVGEIYLRTPYRALGYLDDPEATERAFVPNPFGDDPADRVFRTGDMGRLLPDGSYEFLGRRDQQVKIQGVRVELGEVESLLRARPEVRDAVVVDRADGAGGKSLCAYVVLAEGGTTEPLRQALAAALPEVMVPTAYVAMEELPRTLTGKLDRRALPDPDQVRAAESAEAVAPRTPTEELLAGLWCDLLRLKAVGVHQSFFDLGGHSLLVTQLLSRVRAAFEVTLPLDSVFRRPTIAEMTREIERRRGVGCEVPPLRPRRRAGDAPLSFGQERLWVLDRLDPGNPVYNVPGAMELAGDLDLVALRRALGLVVRRHEALRTVFPTVAGRPVQRVLPPRAAALPLVDLSALPEARREREARRLTAGEAVTGFDLARQTALRTRLVRLSADRWLLLVTLHHVASDDWSMVLLVDECRRAYRAFHEGRTPELPALPVQYADYAVWQREWLQGEVLDRLVDFWRRELGAVAALVDLPLDRPRPAQPSYRGARHPVRLPAELTERLRALGRAEGVTLFMTLMAAFQALLWRHGAQDSFAVGTPVAGRDAREVEGLIGFFINNLVVRSDLSEAAGFRRYLGRVRAIVLDAFAHQELPFDRLVAELAPARDPRFAPVFQVVFALHQSLAEAASPAAGLSVRPVPLESSLVKADLDLDLAETAAGIAGNLWLNSALFDATTGRRLAERLERLLAAVAADPDARLDRLDLLAAEERRQVLCEAEGEAVAGPDPLPLSELVARWAEAAPERLAVDHGEETLTYGGLDRRANQLAHHLRALGVGPETVVGSALDRGPLMVVALLGILRAGGAYLPLDPSYPTERLQTMIEDAGVSVLVTQDDVLDGLPVFFGLPVSLDGGWPAVAAESDGAPEPATGPDHLAYVIYTSGSTGRPKGVLLTHRGLAYVSRLFARLPGGGERVLQFSSPGFDASISEIVTALASGTTLVTAPLEAMRPGRELARLLADRRVTMATLPPSTLAVTPEVEAPHLSTLIAAGEALPAEVARRWSAPHRRLLNFYGPTETTIWATAAPCGGEAAVSLGAPIPCTRLYLVDRRGELALPGTTGEILLGGPGTARGYLGRPALTAERFVPDAFSGRPGERLYRTGDLARRRSDGGLGFVGRADHQVKVRGFRVELGEVEAVLAAHPAVDAAVAVVHADGERVRAFWVSSGAAPEAADLREHLAARLPAHAVPAELVRLDELPRGTSGKVDRKALQTMPATVSAGRARRVADGLLEELVADVFADVLAVPEIGADDDFFELGGYSLAAAQVLSRIAELTGAELPMDRLFDRPTAAGFAAEVRRVLEAGGEAASAPLTRGEPGVAPLTFGQELMWRREREGGGGPDRHVKAFLRLRGDLDVAALARALDAVRERHHVLRSAIRDTADGPVQEVLEHRPQPLVPIDLSAEPEEERLATLGRALRADWSEPFDLGRGHLSRQRLYRLAADDHVLALVWHHVVSDPRSAAIFSRELSALYRACAGGGGAEALPALPVQMADFARWQREWLRGPRGERQVAAWRQRLHGVRPVDLPLDRRGSGVRSAPMASHAGALPAETVAAVRARARRAGATSFLVLSASFLLLLYRLTGQRDLAVWTPVGRRSRSEVEPLIGFFPQATLVRVRLAEEGGFDDLIAEVRRAALVTLGHQDVPFELLAARLPELAAVGDLLRVSTNYIHDPGEIVDLPGLRVGPFELDVERRMEGDLELLFRERGQEVRFDFNYRTDRLDGETVASWADAWLGLLKAALDEPERPLAELVDGGGEILAAVG